MMTAEQRTQLDDLIGRVEDAALDVNVDIDKVRRAGDNIVAYVDSLLAAERAATIEECAKACDAQSNYLEHQQHLLATRKCAAAIRKLGEKHE